MPVEVTREMDIALTVMRRAGIDFHVTRESALPCGCVVYGGWVTELKEPGVRATVCSPEHGAAFERVQARWLDADVLARFGDVESHVAMAELLAEEAARRG